MKICDRIGLPEVRKIEVGLPKEQMVNYVKDIYALHRGEISEEDGGTADAERNSESADCLPAARGAARSVSQSYGRLVLQWQLSLHRAGVKLLNEAFINYIEQVYQF